MGMLECVSLAHNGIHKTILWVVISVCSFRCFMESDKDGHFHCRSMIEIARSRFLCLLGSAKPKTLLCASRNCFTVKERERHSTRFSYSISYWLVPCGARLRGLWRSMSSAVGSFDDDSRWLRYSCNLFRSSTLGCLCCPDWVLMLMVSCLIVIY